MSSNSNEASTTLKRSLSPTHVVAYLTNVPMNSTAIGLIVDGLDGSSDILKFGFHCC